MLTTQEVAERLSRPYPTIALWVRQGRFRNAVPEDTPRGKVWWIPEADLKDFIAPRPGRPSSEMQKEKYEIEIFQAFAQVCGLQIDANSEQNEKPPLPDIRCTINGKLHYFELGTVLDPKMAARRAQSLKTKKITGGSFSQDNPLVKIVSEKSAKDYGVPKESLDLLIYYDHQIPSINSLRSETKKVVTLLIKDMTMLGKWNRIWIYDRNSNQIIYCYPGLE